MDFYKSQVSQYKTWVEVDSRALLHNFRAIQKRVGADVSVMAVVKANAYGHGLLQIAKLLTTEIWFGVDSIDEALILKKAGIKNPILILGYIPRPRLVDVIQNDFRFSLYDLGVLKECIRIAGKLKKKALVHVKIETGTFRQGIVGTQIAAFADILRKNNRWVIAEGMHTHFADTENSSSPYYKEQVQMFEEGISLFAKFGIRPQYRHAAASAAALLYPDTHYNMVRWGIGLYGLYPSEDVQSRALHKIRLRPVLTWKTRVAQVKVVPKRSTIGYNRTYTATRAMRVAVLPVGYWDGYDRRLSNAGKVLIHGKKCPVVGNVCMNMCMVNVTNVPRVRAGDEVVLLGKQGSGDISVDEMAAQIGTINYEVVSRINLLIPRVVT